MELTNENYHELEARKEYMGYSQFKDFLECEAKALAKVNGEYQEEYTTALLVGSYVDAYFSGEMEMFSAAHPEIFTKNGELKSDFKQAEKIIEVIKEDELLSKYLSGEPQVIMTGEIAGVPFKIKMDSYHKGKAIVDQKIMKDMEPVWVTNEYGRNERVNFVEAYKYMIEGAVYQEIERQNSGGEKLPFILAVTTKEKTPDKALLKIDQEDLDEALELVKEKAPRFNQIKAGLLPPVGCGKCDYCRSKQKVTGIFSYHTKDPFTYEA